ncbi:hypothetical protein [Candidatus Mycobacterium methanotrophicum]|uniref:Transposase IS111A/IS1328/IS1533 N-terminal domain-containing protein n=1 Tax=Candidatus Mycobacterium methanotrophicum TaxID=2943498 RepID=A0ABY4QIW7_9MYCO|nr:hypothetical protein [Candidatus Mycobacterium methanotrophicum]UQX10962.1 hypothetical protein M5I08_24110 [Candidatus Mycobacterium methanotrophicum]
MTIVGGLDVHRKQITFDYVDDDGLVHWGQIRPATGATLRRLAEHCPDGDGDFTLGGCTGRGYVVEELAAAGVGVPPLGGLLGKIERPHPSVTRTPGTPSIIMSPGRVSTDPRFRTGGSK